MKLIFLFVGVLFVFNPVFAGPAFLKLADAQKKYHIIEGDYSLVSGTKEECIEGEYKLFEGSKGVLSLKSSEGLIAKHLHAEALNYNERGCSSNYTTVATEKGFENTESVVCPNLKISYVRTVKMKFSEGTLKYRITSNDILGAKKTEINCLLQLVVPQR